MLRFALPKGSLNTPGRWSTESLLKEAGFEIRGYGPESRAFRQAVETYPLLDGKIPSTKCLL